jgi:hypothetical protein
MATRTHRFTAQHLIAAAAFGGLATVLFQSKLDALALRLSPAARQSFSEFWPLSLIFAGGVLWLTHAISERRRGGTVPPATSRGTNQ